MNNVVCCIVCHQEDEVDRYNATIQELQGKRAQLLENSTSCKGELEEAEKSYNTLQSRLRNIGESVDPFKASAVTRLHH